MTSFLVTWRIDTESDTPREAAEEALHSMQTPTEATHFEVKNTATGKTTSVNLGRVRYFPYDDDDFLNGGD